ncbi:dTDP-4-dehydrorhamnose reductase [Tepidibacter mesophilus]|uniref:dTDP-4-dehydrorhamnose reductase n=1 Tax=Tepidibacter mesophilus TaxID=655607 RepID=UPI000C06DF5C|nr:dTDP-4-dehydrorhamnose reductase [Tepidibacter mesophilus]
MNKILVTGAKGQLGIDVVNYLSKSYEVIGLDKDDLDITNLESVLNCINEVNPDVVINCAAYTNVDGCEENQDLAYKINGIGARNLAIASNHNAIKLVHISTDFVFDGETDSVYTEFDGTNPISVYGKSKKAGEDFIKKMSSKYFILRTAWLYGKNGNNFVKTMLRLAETNDTLKIVDDQVGTPTFTEDLVEVIAMVIKTEKYGTYHVSNDGKCSWYEFAKKIFELANVDIEVLSITTEELGRPAKRPKYSVMRNYMLELEFDYHIRSWESALEKYFK